jgi:UDP-N-acetylmuramate--L-alanine ligase
MLDVNFEDGINVEVELRGAGSGAVAYLVGAGGCGMSGLGHLLLDAGFGVAGSDLALNQETEELEARGAVIHQGHAAEHVAETKPFLMAYSSAVRPDNVELAEARRLGCPVVRRARVLSALMNRRRGLCVAGMHGKTTTTSLLAFALEALGAQPSYAIGSRVAQLCPHARFASAPDGWFVAETDESDGSLGYFTPEQAVLLNLDEDHLDYFADINAICREFEAFVQKTRGTVFYCADDVRLAAILGKRTGSVSYGFHSGAKYRALIQGPLAEGGTRFQVWRETQLLGEFRTRLPGEKNVSNATAVVAVLDKMGHTPEKIAEAIAPFAGARRRQELLWTDGQSRIFDDYGHHPREIAATLSALKPAGEGRLLVAFQPHRYTRTQHLLEQFAGCFGTADLLWITGIYAASESPIAGVSGEALTEAVRKEGQTVDYAPDLDSLRRAVREAMKPGDTVVFQGAGDITKAAHELARELEEHGIGA